MTPEIRTLISGVIFMTKYTKEIKLAIYHEWVDDHRRGTYLSQKYGMGRGGIHYLVDLIQKHGEDILDRPQQKYTANFKLAAIDRVLLGGEALSQVSLDLGLTNTGILANWLRSLKKAGILSLPRRKVDHPRMPKSKDKQRIKELEEQVKRLTVELAYIKKLEALSLQERKSQEKKN
jgi:putative transposase